MSQTANEIKLVVAVDGRNIAAGFKPAVSLADHLDSKLRGLANLNQSANFGRTAEGKATNVAEIRLQKELSKQHAEALLAARTGGEQFRDALQSVRSTLGGVAQGLAVVGAVGGGVFASLAGMAHNFTAAANPFVIERLGHEFDRLKAVVGRELVPVFEKVTRVIQGAADWLYNLPKPVKQFAVAAGVATAAVGLLVGTVAAGAAVVVGALSLVAAGISAVGVIANVSFGGLPLILGAVVTGVTAIAAAFGVGSVAAAGFWASSKEGGAQLKSVWEWLKGTANDAWAAMMQFYEALKPAFSSIGDSIASIATSFQPLFEMHWDTLVLAMKAVAGTIVLIANSIASVVEGVAKFIKLTEKINPLTAMAGAYKQAKGFSGLTSAVGGSFASKLAPAPPPGNRAEIGFKDADQAYKDIQIAALKSTVGRTPEQRDDESAKNIEKIAAKSEEQASLLQQLIEIMDDGVDIELPSWGLS